MDAEQTHWTTAELHELGSTRRSINRQLADGTLHRLGRGLYTSSRPTGEEALRAIRHAHPQVIFSGASAAGAYGLCGITAPATGLVPPNYRPSSTPLLMTTRSRNRRHRVVDRIPVTTPAATIADTGHIDYWKRVKFLETSYDGLRGRDTFAADHRALTPVQRQALAPVLANAVIGASSRMDRLFLVDLRKAGLDVIPNFRFGSYTWDGGIPNGTTLFDLDSYLYHGPDEDGTTRRTFITDRWKSNHASMLGWGSLRYTDCCLEQTRREAVEQILQLVHHRRATRGRRRTPAAVPGRHNRGVWAFHGSFY